MPTGSNAQKEHKRYLVATGLLAGKSQAVIAGEAGCQPRHVRRLAREPATHFLIRELLRPYGRQLARCTALAVSAIFRALQARKQTTEDHGAQLAGVGRLAKLLKMAQG